MALDSCINNLFEPGNWASDSGAISRPQYSGLRITKGDVGVGFRNVVSMTKPPTAPYGIGYYIYQNPPFTVGVRKVQGS